MASTLGFLPIQQPFLLRDDPYQSVIADTLSSEDFSGSQLVQLMTASVSVFHSSGVDLETLSSAYQAPLSLISSWVE